MADDLFAGLYETVVTEALSERLSSIDSHLVELDDIPVADAPERIAQLVANQVRRTIEAANADKRVELGVQLARRLFDVLYELSGRPEDEAARPVEPGQMLNAIGEWQVDGSVRVPSRPLIPLPDTTLLTNSPGEPRVGNQILREIESADSIDIVMAFIRKSGIFSLVDALRAHTGRGKRLRILTTTYTGSTEKAALDLLAGLGAEIKVSYDLSKSRLHAKAWIFRRHSSFSTAYVGSSNLTYSAQSAGMEWNVRLSTARNPDVVSKIDAVFSAYWQNPDFADYDPATFQAELDRQRRPDTSRGVLSPLGFKLEPFQERLLELIALSRENGHHRNLLASATGTGKTVMAAVDYARLRRHWTRARLLFVAHRREILDKSRATFQQVLRDLSFGETWVAGSRPTEFEHVFASIQSLTAQGLEHLPEDHFDVVIIDEFHHAGAASYRALLDKVKPRELLGLTATPERSDGLPILHWFDDRIAAELRLWDAIEQRWLTPFTYYGIHDGTDLRDVPWRRGNGYDTDALTDKYVANDAWADLVYHEMERRVDDVTKIRGLGFCVSVEHARFMAAHFQKLGVAAVAVWGKTPDAERAQALADLEAGRVQVVFSVDLFNEGVDVPTVDCLLMLRPTESPTLFLQQLGRGLRRADEKSTCTVLDFVGTHRKEFRFDRRYRALLGGTRRDLEKAIKEGFPFLPAGCHMELDRKSSEIVLRSIREAVPTLWRAKVTELRALYEARGDVSLRDYLAETGLDIGDIYGPKYNWSAMREAAGLPVQPAGDNEETFRRGVGRMLHIDDPQRLDGFRSLLDRPEGPKTGSMNKVERRLLRMLVTSLADQTLRKSEWKEASLQRAADLVWSHPQVMEEVRQVMDALAEAPNHLQHSAMPDVPLQVHGRYTRLEILAAVGEDDLARTPEWREGVYDAASVGADLLVFTLDKTSGDFSPTTRYRDYAISPDLIHWESQSYTRADSKTGQRYQHHVAMNRTILLFARARADERAFWFLGPATYVSHEGEQPMAVTWRLDTPLSGDLFAAFAAAVA